jgi:hypothetical protein
MTTITTRSIGAFFLVRNEPDNPILEDRFFLIIPPA